MLRWIALAAYGLFLLGMLFVYPALLSDLLEAWGVRWVAGLGLLAGLVSLPVARSFGAQGQGPLLSLGAPVLLVLAAGLESVAALRLIPSWIQLCVGIFFLESLRGGESLILQGARWLVPEAPDFVAPYCRKLTACWGLFFLAWGVLSAGLALAGQAEAWRLLNGPGLWLSMLVLTGIEFLVRKTWFRYYFHGGPFDRLWSRLFPAEATAQGRRSLEAIRRHRESRESASRP